MLAYSNLGSVTLKLCEKISAEIRKCLLMKCLMSETAQSAFAANNLSVLEDC